MLFITWIYVAFITVHLVYGFTTCPSIPPQDIRPACPGSPLETNYSKEACLRYNPSCCWTDSGNDEKPNCYYVPDLKKTIYNAALGKSTRQSSDDFFSSWAVDGCNTEDCCARTDNSSNSSWLSVDLQERVPIVSVTVFIAPELELSMELEILASNISDDPENAMDKMKCTNEVQHIYSSEPKTIVCKDNTYGRYIIIQKPANSSHTYLSICEVQIETAGRYNAAYGKSTWQSTTPLDSKVIHARAFKNVDGSLNNNHWGGYCSQAASYTDKNPWWSVDLGQVLTVYSVTLVNRWDSDNSLKRLIITVSNTTHVPEAASVVCSQHRQQIPTASAKNIRCSKPLNARFVMVQKTRANELSMCEVIVETACPDGRYGPNCWHTCNHCMNNLPCDKVTGHCPGRLCLEGYQGDRCDKACPDGRYGPNCWHTCNHCMNNLPCDKVTGHCPGGLCLKGYQGDRCDKECSPGYFGQNCSQICSGNCRNNNTCNNIDGSCHSCTDGYRGSRCNLTCIPGTYGEKCLYNCSGNCKDNIDCLPQTGLCPYQLCQPGYMGPNCDKACIPGTYGEKCLYNCSGNCKDNIDCLPQTGLCPNQLCQPGYMGPKCDKVTVHNVLIRGTEIQSQRAVIAAFGIAAVVVVVVIVLVVILLVFLVRKQKITQLVRDIYAPTSMPSVKPNSDSNISIIKEEPVISKTLVEVKNIQAYVQQMEQNEAFQLEYMSIPRSVSTMEYASQPNLSDKNRYRNVLPYDNNRVLLQKIEDDLLSDYINASYIEDYEGKKSYIASQGTTKHTNSDFWRMIWEQNIKAIVMLTQVVEGKKMKCTKYWPDDSDTLTTDTGIVVKLKGVTSENQYVTRIFSISKSGTTREVIHYHYLEWPDNGVPENKAALQTLIREIKTHREKRETPILVHCSAGVGRTGTVIALDILSEQAESENAVDIYKCVYRLREQRISMVQALAQYIFIHDYLKEMVTVSVNGKAVMDLEQVNGTDNKKKDKSVDFYATQVPKKNTVEDFWKFIWEESCTSVVCLENDPEYSEWFPSDKQNNIHCGKYCITIDDETTDDLIKLYDVTIQLPDLYNSVTSATSKNEKDSHKLKVFIMPEDWSKTSVSERDTKELIHLYTLVQNWQKQSGDSVITVMCLNGAKETGVYIAASSLFEAAGTDRDMNVFNIVQEIRTLWPQMIAAQEQYIYLQMLAQEYMNQYADYVDIVKDDQK